jgi:hypothetical protein
MEIFGRLRHLSSVLGRVPSLAYALLYLGLIPIFASLYYFGMKNDFYHSTAQFERNSFGNAAAEIRTDIDRSIQSTINTENDGTSCPNWSIDGTSLQVSMFDIDGELMHFRIYVHLVSLSGPHTEQYLELKATSQLHPSMSDWSSDGKVRNDYYMVESDEHFQPHFKGDLGSEGLLSCLFPPQRDGFLVPSLRLDGHETELLHHCAQAKLGFPSELSGQFVRMLYLSASTITTLGFGDIVPLTSAVRLAVSCEAICGILVMGLFLNAVSKEK